MLYCSCSSAIIYEKREKQMKGYVLLSHGSKVKASNDANKEILEKLRKNIAHVELAFLELAEPSFEEAIKKLTTSGITKITVLPLFLAPGKHVQEDVPSLASNFSKKYDTDIKVLEHIGARDEYVALIEAILMASK
ncbi:MAG: sirohydrochlorin cobaltochelatase [Campylobacterota bacterium]|nr:sirohydrochlorin cobaltochelatase [Campylobacterota bacterium]